MFDATRFGRRCLNCSQTLPQKHHMNPPNASTWLNRHDAQLSELKTLCATTTPPEWMPWADRVEQQVPIYDCRELRNRLAQAPASAQALMAEWVWVWQDGPGIVVLQHAHDDDALVDAVTRRFETIIEREKSTQSGGDHFAQAGANDRVWNALEKLCLDDPALFARYYANDMAAMACRAWLGPGYQVTSQVNNVRPGGMAQQPHRDYHLGFCTPEQAQAYPRHVHLTSPTLTLQGAVAHVDMPLESGPTLYLPHSQKWAHGYLVADRQDVSDYFAQHRVQLPLLKGDAVFFNPALIHAAGHNRSANIQRMANLLQVSSAFGRAMESVNRQAMTEAVYPHLQALLSEGTLNEAAAHRAIDATAEGYAFPTNLDRDPPLGGLAPASPQAVVRQALREGWTPAQLNEHLAQLAWRRQT
ncbi:MAG: hypothetical protein RL323_969 [Pseudomonadota bacterium]